MVDPVPGGLDGGHHESLIMKGGLDGGHDEGCLLDHSQEFALDDRGFPDSRSSQAGKHDGPHWLS